LQNHNCGWRHIVLRARRRRRVRSVR
jgi:hypothetical protein